MANKADVNVKNVFNTNVMLHLKRQLQDGSSDLEINVAQGEVKMVQLPDPNVSMVIQAPEGMDLRDCLIKVKSDVDLDVQHSRTLSYWTLKIIPNDLPPDVPTSVNVVIGQDEPE